MGFPLIAAAALPVAQNMFNAQSTIHQNQMNQMWSEQMYEKQRKDSIEFWNMQNAYNSPEEMMKRFSAAGLNPNLIYGNAGNNSAGNIPTPDVQPVNFRSPRWEGNPAADVVSGMLAMADLRIKNAQADNLGEQTEVIRQDAALRAWQAKQAGFNFDYATEMRGTQADFLRESVRQKRISTDLAISADARAAISTAYSVSEAAERIKQMIEQRKGFTLERDHTLADTRRIYENIRQMQKDGRIKDFEIMLNRSNVSKSDPLWSRLIADFLSGQSSLLNPIGKIPPGTNFQKFKNE